jgi:hypothetical protein
VSRFPIWNLREKGKSVGKRHYIAVYTDSGYICGCEHRHPNIATATACISQPGGYVVAVRRGKTLRLTEVEEAEFQKLMYGRPEPVQQGPDIALLINGKLETTI